MREKFLTCIFIKKIIKKSFRILTYKMTGSFFVHYSNKNVAGVESTYFWLNTKGRVMKK